MKSENIREKTHDYLFSDKTLTALCEIISENSNFKTRIHAVQTLSKYRDYCSFKDEAILVWEAFLNGLQNVTETTDFTDVGYINQLESKLIELFVKMVNTESTTSGQKTDETFSEFLNAKGRDLETAIVKYLQKQFKVTAFSAVYEEELDATEVYKHNPLLKDTIRNLQTAFKKIVDLISAKDEIKIPFSVFETFGFIANTDIEEFASLDLLKAKKSAFDKDQF